MTTAIKKLIENIDQLVLWLNENPTAAIPSQEKNRLTTVLNKIIKREVLSEKEWLELRPNIPLTKQVIIHGSPTKRKTTISSIKRTRSNEKPSMPLPLLPPRPKQSDTLEIVIRSGKRWVVCPNCKVTVLEKNIQKHRKKCKSHKKKDVPKSNPRYSPKVSQKEDYKQEKRLDGSYGYHVFRDNGQFGSHPSFDNMNDDSNP